jgi:hypothetical protein
VRERVDTQSQARDNPDRIPSEPSNQLIDDLFPIRGVLATANDR